MADSIVSDGGIQPIPIKAASQDFPAISVAPDATVQYRAIPGFPGYRVGDDGSVWSYRSSNGRMADRPHRLKPTRNNKHGHLCVTLCCSGKHQTHLVHRIVLEAFVGPCPDGMEACHDPDKVPTNNRLDNLRWDTKAANEHDKARHGTKLLGENHPRSKLTVDIVVRIMEFRLIGGFSPRKICLILGLPISMRHAVEQVAYGYNWNSVTGLLRPKRNNGTASKHHGKALA